MITKLIEISRILIITGGILLTNILFAHDPIAQLHWMLLSLSVGLSGLSGIEGIFFHKEAAAALGRAPNRPYQIQSGINSLSIGLVGVFVACLHWGVYAEVAILLCILTFFTLSATVHVAEIFILHNRHKKNVLRGVLMTALLIDCIPLIFQAIHMAQ